VNTANRIIVGIPSQSRGVVGAVVDREGLRLRPTGRGLAPSALVDVALERTAGRDTIRISFGATQLVARAAGVQVEGEYGKPLELIGVRFGIASHPGIADATIMVVPRDEIIDDLIGNLRVKVRDRTDVLELQFMAADPLLAERVANAHRLLPRSCIGSSGFSTDLSRLELPWTPSTRSSTGARPDS
jgi:hypothetical protein